MLRIAAATGLVLLSCAALADDKGDCQDGKDHDLRIKGCSAIILRNPKDVVAYHNRGDAYGLKGDIDRAISDYNKAIELNANYAPAYNSRGRAYTSKGDYTRAVADVTKAGELTPKPGPMSAAMNGSTDKSKKEQTPKSGLVARKPELLPPAGMLPLHKSNRTPKPRLAAHEQEPFPVGMGTANQSKQVAKRGLAIEIPLYDPWPEWAQSTLNN